MPWVGCRLHDGMEAGLDRNLVGLADLVEDISDLVRPAALLGDVGIDHRQAAKRPEPPLTEIISGRSAVRPRL